MSRNNFGAHRPAKLEVKSPPMEDFPLPPELKDEIYSYLLHPDAAREDSNPPAASITEPQSGYHFETAILRVNKRINTDTTRYFGKANTFVRIFPACQELLRHLHILRARVYAIGTLGAIPCVAYGVEFFQPPVFFCGGSQDHHFTRESHTVIILERDLAKIWMMVRGGTYAMPKDCVHVRSGQGKELVIAVSTDDDAERIPTVRVWAFRNKSVGLSAERKQAFFDSACAAFSKFYDVSYHGFDGIDKGSLQMSKPATMIWPLAFEWHKFDTLLALKQEADSLALAGTSKKLLEALILYEYAQYCSNDYFRSDPSFRKYAKLVRPAMRALHFDIRFSLALTRLRAGIGYYEAAGVLRPETGNQLSLVATRFDHFVVINDLCGTVGPPSAAVLNGALQQLQNLSPSDEILHDIKYLRGLINVQSTKAPQRSPVLFWRHYDLNGKFSFQVFPFQVVDTASYQGYHGRPNGLDGWQDVKRLAELSDKEKEIINSFQKKHRLRRTEF